ncbi:MAG: pyridoxine 5'-phosphate synthase [Gammaproteobacteria bacterium]
MTALSVNVNKVAWLRNGRGGNDPDVLWAARTAVEAGAHGITVHPRPDQRHIQPRDVHQIAKYLSTRESIEYNIEGNPFEAPLGDYPGMLALAKDTRPAQVTLVPDSVDQITSNRGWAVSAYQKRLQDHIAAFKDLGCRVSLFMDSDSDEYELVAELGADRIELYTEDYARAHEAGEFEATRERYRDAAQRAQSFGLGVNAGHDLSLANLSDFLEIDDVLEVSIGHALISDALKYGLHASVQKYLGCLPNV